MPWDLVITKPAERDLKEPSRDDLRRINGALEAMRGDPYSGDVKFLKGEVGQLRRRVGAWRIFFRVEQSKHLVAYINHLLMRPVTTQASCCRGRRRKLLLSIATSSSTASSWTPAMASFAMARTRARTLSSYPRGSSSRRITFTTVPKGRIHISDASNF
jgi:mRNA-degrading endonuclease RelE of RelBE toxin-antitoxin system